MGYRKIRATCEAYTSAMPYAVWHELLREVLELGREEPDDAVEQRLRTVVADKVPDLAPWLPLVGAALDLDLAPTPEVEALADENRRAKLHDSVERFLVAVMPGPAIVEVDDAHHMDEASVELLAYLLKQLPERQWLLGVARRPLTTGYVAAELPTVSRVELHPLAQGDALRLAQLASKDRPLPSHVIEVVAQRSGGNPQFLRDLLRSAIESGGVVGLPDSAEAAALARIDALSPDDRALVRRAAVFGLTFHPRMLAWFDDPEDGPPPGDDAWARLSDMFVDDGDGYLRFRQSLLRDTAYEGLPFRQRRRLHATVATHVADENDDPDDVAGILSLHYHVAGEFEAAGRYSTIAARRAEDVYAYVEAAGFFIRALDAARNAAPSTPGGCIGINRSPMRHRAAEYRKAADAYAEARKPSPQRLAEAGLLLKHLIEEKLGNYPGRWTGARGRRSRANRAARPIGCCERQRVNATVLQAWGKSTDAFRCRARSRGRRRSRSSSATLTR
jgi:predicted ATPase